MDAQKRGNEMNKLVTEFTEDSHLQGNRYFRVVPVSYTHLTLPTILLV